MTVRVFHIAALALSLVLTSLVPGCLASHEDVTGVTSAALDYGIEPVGTVPEYIWREVAQSCDGLLSGVDDMEFARAENAPGLGVALDEDGEPVCVDSWAAIHAELEDIVKGDPSPDPMDRFIHSDDE